MKSALNLTLTLIGLFCSIATSRGDDLQRVVPRWEAAESFEGETMDLVSGDAVTRVVTLGFDVPVDEDLGFTSEFVYGQTLSYNGPFTLIVTISDLDGGILAERTFTDTASNDEFAVKDVFQECVAGAHCSRNVIVDAEVTDGAVQVAWNLYVHAVDDDVGADDTAELPASIEVQ